MKKLFILFSLLSTLFSIAQTSFFVDEKGKKTIMRDDSIEFIVRDKRIAYAEYGKSWEKFIKYDDIDYAIMGEYYMKSYKLIKPDGKFKKKSAYFVMVETDTKQLICYTYVVIGKYSSVSIYNIYIVEENGTILDSFEITSADKFSDKRKNIKSSIKKHFSECTSFMETIDAINDTDEKHISILSLFDSPTYSNCN